MNKKFDMVKAQDYLSKWQEILRLRDWDIRLHEVDKKWRKTGDIKIDEADRRAVLMINNYNPHDDNLEALIIHELLHLKLWGMDQMIEDLIVRVFGDDENDVKYSFAFKKFMDILEPTVEDLAKGYLLLGGEDKSLSFGRINEQIKKELLEKS